PAARCPRCPQSCDRTPDLYQGSARRPASMSRVDAMAAIAPVSRYASRRLLVLLVVVHLGELGIDHVFLGAAGLSAAGAGTGATLRIHRLAELHRRLGK